MPLKTKGSKKQSYDSYQSSGDYESGTGTQSASGRKIPFAVVESYKTIRTNILFLLAQTGGKIIALTSANAGEGKSTTAVNISIAFSQLSGKVLLIDADMRRSSIHKKLKLTNTSGLSDVLAGFSKLEDSVTAFNANLDILTSGAVPPNPSELLGSKAMDSLLASLKETYDYIVIDTPPINIVSDALLIAPKTDGLIMVVRDGFTPHDSMKRALGAAEFANITVLGAIMNGANPKSNRRYSYRKYSYGKKYGYGYGYGYGGYGYGYGSSYGKNYESDYANHDK